MRKKALSMILAATVCLQLVGCGGSSTSSQSNGGDTTAADSGSDQADTQAEKEDSAASSSEGGSDELVDGKFAETKHITVEVYDRGNDGGTDPTNNMYTKYIQDGMLNDYNVEVEFKSVPRWTELCKHGWCI